jgi:MinD-like ATPase involved in chromosome partitioning or flagellar assembly
VSEGPPAVPPTGRGQRVAVLLAAGSAAWEAEAVALLADAGQVVHLLQRCLDLADLLGAAATGAAEVAVVSHHLPGLDADSVARLHRDGVRVVAVLDPRGGGRLTSEALHRLDVDLVVGPEDLPALAARLREVVRDQGTPPSYGDPGTDETPDDDGPGDLEAAPAGRLIAVWGTSGAPGRTTTAVALAAEAAARGHSTLLLDADPYGGAVAQHLGILDEASGLLGATRLANSGQLDPSRLAALCRALDPGLRVLTGLPRPSRWTEVRPAAFGEVLAGARRLDDVVVVDTGSGIEPGSDDPFEAGPNRDETTRTVLTEADAVVAVVAPDPVGMQRAARALVDLAELRPSGADVVAVNRMRPTLGWDRRDVVGLLGRVAPAAQVAFLPDDAAAADRALVTGRTLVESGDSALRRAVAVLTADVLGVLGFPTVPERPVRRRLRRRTA